MLGYIPDREVASWAILESRFYCARSEPGEASGGICDARPRGLSGLPHLAGGAPPFSMPDAEPVKPSAGHRRTPGVAAPSALAEHPVERRVPYD